MMKKLSLLLSVFFLTINLSARENPFYPSEAYTEELERIVEQEEMLPEEQAYVDEYQKKLKLSQYKNNIDKSIKKIVPVSSKKKVYTNNELDKKINKNTFNKDLEKDQIVYVKPRPDAIKLESESLVKKNIFTFLDISYNDNIFVIDSKQKLFRKIILEKEKKLVFDFYGKKNFYTIRDILNLKRFDKLTIGSHKRYGYFRVVLKLTNKIDSYDIENNDTKVEINYKN